MPNRNIRYPIPTAPPTEEYGGANRRRAGQAIFARFFRHMRHAEEKMREKKPAETIILRLGQGVDQILHRVTKRLRRHRF
jgi:hypothetical protein